MTTAHLNDDLRQVLSEHGLQPRAIQRHRSLLVKALSEGKKPQFKILDTCRRDNGGILPPPNLALQHLNTPSTAVGSANAGQSEGPASGFVAFIPAAGAASRYSQPLTDVIEALENNRQDILGAALRILRDAGAQTWPLPPSVQELLAAADQQLPTLDERRRLALLHDLQLPKALMPCVSEGMSFLAVKDREHRALRGLEAEVYVTPQGMQAAFADELARVGTAGRTSIAGVFLEQGPALSTIRFETSGDPYQEDDGNVSIVPAGHGTLAKLFPEVAQRFPRAHSLFIRNIDNIMGLRPKALAATEDFLSFHASLLRAVQNIRKSLAEERYADAANFARPLLRLPEVEGNDAVMLQTLAGIKEPNERTLWEVLFKIFHVPASIPTTRERLEQLYRRPVNTLGQVPNTAQDVGGTPCFVVNDDKTCKVCIEVPHVSSKDKQDYLANPEKATHFNPVFAAAELTDEADYYEGRNQDFWLLAEKCYRGKPVVYFETVLYELLGNSDLANAVFIEVPRIVFNPHKVLKDAMNRSVHDWFPE